MSLLIDPNDPNLKNKVDSLPPVPGYCVFIDIVDSTKMKEATRREWIVGIYNTFANAHTWLSPFVPLKSIGDALMYYITDADLDRVRENPLHIFSGLRSLVSDKEPLFKPVKIGAARCTDVYGITFVRGTNDYYGCDIDLTSRLQKMASEREIVINAAFYNEIRRCYDKIGNKEQFSEVDKICGPWLERFKGFDDYIEIYKLPRCI